MRILAVDDNPLVLDMLTSLFKQTEFPDISVASSSAETLALLGKKDSRFDCLILDIEMPRMNGIELCSEIRKIEGYQETPIIMLTTRNDAESIEASFAAGANDYIFKRFNVKEFTNRVRVAARLQT
ncbi:MAG: response regulator, partial [Pseudomonadales bacterium]